jgi:hypothetical protein
LSITPEIVKLFVVSKMAQVPKGGLVPIKKRAVIAR